MPSAPGPCFSTRESSGHIDGAGNLTSGGTSLTYDPLGRLYQTSSATYGAVQRLYDGQHVVAEYNGAGTMPRRFYWGPGADEPIVQDEGGALDCTGTRFLHGDDLGSIVATADCWGNQQAVNTYDEYGIPGSSGWGRFLYTGQAWVPDLGMLYYKARLYSPTLGRFMQTDPIGYGDGPNGYAYVHNNPIGGSDPTGEIGADDNNTDTGVSSVTVSGCGGGAICGPGVNNFSTSVIPSIPSVNAPSVKPAATRGRGDATTVAELVVIAKKKQPATSINVAMLNRPKSVILILIMSVILDMCGPHDKKNLRRRQIFLRLQFRKSSQPIPINLRTRQSACRLPPINRHRIISFHHQ